MTLNWKEKLESDIAAVAADAATAAAGVGTPPANMALDSTVAKEATLGSPADTDIATDIANVQTVVDLIPTVTPDAAGVVGGLIAALPTDISIDGVITANASVVQIAADAATAAGHNNPDAAGTAAGIIDTTDKLNKLIAVDDRPAALKYPSSVVTESILAFLMSKSADPSTFEMDTDSLEALADAIAAIAVLAAKTIAGRPQVKAVTVDLHNAAGAQDVATCSTQAVIIDSIVFSPRVDISDDAGAFTGISIQDNDTTVHQFISSSNGVKANLTQYGQLAWTGAVKIRVGNKIQCTIIGASTEADPTTCDVEITYHAVVDGGTL